MQDNKNHLHDIREVINISCGVIYSLEVLEGE